MKKTNQKVASEPSIEHMQHFIRLPTTLPMVYGVGFPNMLFSSKELMEQGNKDTCLFVCLGQRDRSFRVSRL
jgi:hypothetical protein